MDKSGEKDPKADKTNDDETRVQKNVNISIKIPMYKNKTKKAHPRAIINNCQLYYSWPSLIYIIIEGPFMSIF